MYYGEEILWSNFVKLNEIRNLPLQEQIMQYNRYVNDLSTIRYFNTDYSHFNTNANIAGPFPTTTPPPTISSVTVCIGDGTVDACDCNNQATVYFAGTEEDFGTGIVIYSDPGLTTLYYNGVLPDINYNGSLYQVNFGVSALIFNGSCS